MRADRRGRLALVGISLLSLAAAIGTAVGWRVMPAMRGIAMPGGWTLSMIWMPIKGGSWPGAAASFVTMWTAMMVPMMLPAVAPSLRDHHRRLAARGEAHAGTYSAFAAAGYVATWTALGTLLFPLGAYVAAWMMHSPAAAHAIPAVTSLVVIAGGAVQFTHWKGRRLVSCDQSLRCDAVVSATIGASWRRGVRLGLDCCASCANWMAILVAVGVMEPAAMLAVTGAISAERLSRRDSPTRRLTGSVAIVAGVVLLVRGRAVR